MDLPQTPFWSKFNGRFSGLLNWQDVDQLWEVLSASRDDWYVFDMDGDLPNQCANATEFANFLSVTLAFLRKRLRGNHVGFVYTDNRVHPQFVKIFDPQKMGVSCGVSSARVFPRWTLSMIAPDLPLPIEKEPTTGFLSKLIN